MRHAQATRRKTPGGEGPWLRLVCATLVAIALLGGGGRAGAAPAGHEAASTDVSFDEYVPGASRLEGRLLAPCCWDSSRQTLDIHGSPIANELRREIRTRLKAGETPEAVEADLVRRYTKKILASPNDDALPRVGALLSVALLGAGVLAARMVRRWRRQSREAPVPAPATGPQDQWDARIDAELEDKD